MKKDNKLPEEEQVQLHKILPPEKPEVPEEGFVPYCAAADADTRTKRKTVILIVLAAVLLLLTLGVFLARRMNFYRKTLNALTFDYRTGEAVNENSANDLGAIAKKISAQMEGKKVHASAVTYSFNVDGGMYTDIASYDYTRNGAESLLDVRTASEKSLFSKKLSLRSTGSAIDRKKGSKWVTAEGEYIPDLYDYFFATEDHGDITLECCDAYETDINSKIYNCEIWLMQQGAAVDANFTTLYRYYDGETLAGVRILYSTDTVMDVYDVKSYEFN